jgi:two-component system, OmpR family, alkaline phosphatase synthesis response regulator PhoP
MTRVLVADDDSNLLNVVAFVLRQEGYEVVTARDGDEAVQMAQECGPSALVLDLMMPRRSGFDVCQAIRSYSNLPILMLTARDSEGDKVKGFELGADDYLTKPFSTRELVARVKALLRRAGASSPHPIGPVRVGDLTIDLAGRTVTVGGRLVKLTPTEFKLLQCLAARPGMVHSSQELVWQVHNFECTEQEANELIKVLVRRLRRKIEPDPDQPAYVVNVRGFGYTLSLPTPQAALA